MRVDRERVLSWMRVGRESARGWMRASVAADVRTHWLARSRSRCARAGRALVAKAHSLTARRSREHAPLACEPRKRTCALRHAHISSGLATSNTGGALLGGPTRPISILVSQRGNQWLCQTKIDTNSCLLILEPGLLWPGFRKPPPPPDGRGGSCGAGGASPAGPTRSMSILVKHRAGKVSVKPRLARTHVLPAPSRAPLAGRPARPPPDGSGASEAPGRSARGGANRAHINLGLT